MVIQLCTALRWEEKHEARRNRNLSGEQRVGVPEWSKCSTYGTQVISMTSDGALPQFFHGVTVNTVIRAQGTPYCYFFIVVWQGQLPQHETSGGGPFHPISG